MIDLSIIVATYNRPDRLECLLRSLVQQNLENYRIEIVVIENSENLSSRNVFEKFLKSETNGISWKYFHERKVGLSNARNLGIANSEGRIIGFIDDDAITSKDWIKEIVSSYSCNDIVAVGGIIQPIEALSEDIFQDEASIQRTFKYYDGMQQLSGSNMTFRKEIFRFCGNFPEDLGRKGKCRLAGEETYLICNITSKNLGKICLNKNAIVFHPTIMSIEEFKLDKKCSGISGAIILRKTNPGKKVKKMSEIIIGYAWRLFKYGLLSVNSKKNKKELRNLRYDLLLLRYFMITFAFGRSLSCRICEHYKAN